MTEAETTNFLAPEAAARLRVSESTLARWRGTGKGPEYIKSGGRVLYAEEDLRAYEQKNKRTKTRPNA